MKCAWCVDFNGAEKQHFEVSHGICADCVAKLMKQAERRHNEQVRVVDEEERIFRLMKSIR